MMLTRFALLAVVMVALASFTEAKRGGGRGGKGKGEGGGRGQ